MDWINKLWFIEWWNVTQNWAAKMLVIQAVGAKIAAIVAILCLFYLGAWVLETALQILPFRVWSNEMYTRNLTLWHAGAMTLFAISIIVMGKCNV